MARAVEVSRNHPTLSHQDCRKLRPARLAGRHLSWRKSLEQLSELECRKANLPSQGAPRHERSDISSEARLFKRRELAGFDH